jgi:putative FmdB family regulatory protein
MPTYDFECVKCHHRFERRRSFNDNGGVKCPHCHSKAKQVFTSVPVIFKGSGFYVTDQRQGGKVKAEAVVEKKSETKKTEGSTSKPGATTV